MGSSSKKHQWFKIYREGKGPNPIDIPLKWKVSLLNTEPSVTDWTAEVICNRYHYGDYALHPVAGHLPVVSEQDLEQWRDQGKDNLLKGEDRSGNISEAKIGDPKTFEMLVHSGNAEKGKSFLGVLKADVDNLGLLFSQGLRKKEVGVSISRFASLSRMVNHFFAQHLVKV